MITHNERAQAELKPALIYPVFDSRARGDLANCSAVRTTCAICYEVYHLNNKYFVQESRASHFPLTPELLASCKTANHIKCVIR